MTCVREQQLKASFIHDGANKFMCVSMQQMKCAIEHCELYFGSLNFTNFSSIANKTLVCDIKSQQEKKPYHYFVTDTKSSKYVKKITAKSKLITHIIEEH